MCEVKEEIGDSSANERMPRRHELKVAERGRAELAGYTAKIAVIDAPKDEHHKQKAYHCIVRKACS